MRKVIDRESPIPLYYQLKEIIKSRAESGELMPNDMLESEETLSKLYNLSRNTVRKAISELKYEGLVYKIQGRGTFIKSPKISHRFVTVVSFTEELLARGMKPSSVLLGLKIETADGEVAEKLEINPGDKYYAIKRLRLGDGKPLGINLSRIPVKLCFGLDKYDLTSGSLYSLIEKEYGHKIIKVVRIMETIPADIEVANMLKIREAFPVLRIIGIAYNQDKIPMDYCVEYYID